MSLLTSAGQEPVRTGENLQEPVRSEGAGQELVRSEGHKSTLNSQSRVPRPLNSKSQPVSVSGNSQSAAGNTLSNNHLSSVSERSIDQLVYQRVGTFRITKDLKDTGPSHIAISLAKFEVVTTIYPVYIETSSIGILSILSRYCLMTQ